ncbi:MAG: TIGR02266 family protein, partial [Deltaproteobacteria bacterium]|nr:TIGR02266 family protein [Kofleriaceae bacterium]
MAADDAKRPATALRIKVRHADIDSFVERFAVNIARSGIFIPTRQPKPVGDEIRFEIRLATDQAVLVGQGVVRWTREYDPAAPKAVVGMGVALQRVSKESRDVLLRMLEVRRQRGLPDPPGGLPQPPDEDELPRAREEDSTTQVRTAPAGRDDDGKTQVRAVPRRTEKPTGRTPVTHDSPTRV